MIANSTLPELNDSELDVMKVFWERGKLSAREVHEAVAESCGWAYSTTRTVLDRMVGKDLLARRLFHGLYVYEAAISRPRGLAHQVRRFAHQVLGTDWAPVVSLFAHSQTLSAKEVEELARILAEESNDAPEAGAGGER